MNESLFFLKKTQSKQSEVNQVAFVWSSYGSDKMSAYTVLAYHLWVYCKLPKHVLWLRSYLQTFIIESFYVKFVTQRICVLSLLQSRLSRIFQKFRLTISLRFVRGFAKQLTTKSVCVLNIDSSKMGCVLNISSF